jgi:DNA-binding NarL/FixJ family response regulator
MRILIADDHDVVREGLRELLNGRPGWEVCAEARNGLEAVDMARRVQPDVAILDLAMPMLDGLEATRRIRQAMPGTAVLLFTVHSSEELAAQAFEAGASCYLLKSHSAEELLSAVEAATQRLPSSVPRPATTLGQHTPFVPHTVQTLTSREREIVQLVSEGKSNKEMGAMLGISVKTVETHRAHLMHKLGSASVAELVHYAVRNGMIDP